MNIKDFSQSTILTGKQYGTTVTIELDHSDTSIDEVMDGFLTIVKGLGYLDTTINQWITNKAIEIKEEGSEYDKTDKNWNESNEFDETDEEIENYFNTVAMDTNYGLATDSDIEECELNDTKVYPQHSCWCGNDEMCDCISEPNDNDEYIETDEYDDYGQRIETERPHFEWGDEPEEEVDEEIEPLFDGEEFKPNQKLKMAAQKYSEEVRSKHTPIKEQKVLGEWQTKNKNKKVVMDKTKVRKGKIKDLKK